MTGMMNFIDRRVPAVALCGLLFASHESIAFQFQHSNSFGIVRAPTNVNANANTKNSLANSFHLPHHHSNEIGVTSRLYAAEEDDSGDDDGLSLKSVNKKITYNAEEGRFFEQIPGEEDDCLPEDEYCVIDKSTGSIIRLTVKEKERIFLDALQSYYISGRQLLSDSEFDLLKEDLAWNGSPMAVMNRKETKYLAALQGYLKGDPIITDEEFDTLKKELKEDGSRFAVSTEPKCYIDTGVCTVTLKEDKFRSNLLYLPMGAILFIAWLGVGFEVVEKIIRLNPLFLIALGSPLIVKGATFLTENFIFTDAKIAYGPCPSCEAENRVYFGGILGVDGFGEVAEVKCTNCKTDFSVQRSTLRASTLPKN